MDTINVSVTPEQAEYIRRSTEHGFGNASEFFRDMLRERMQREIQEDLSLLEKTGPAPAGPAPEEIEEILATQRRVRKDLRARRA